MALFAKKVTYTIQEGVINTLLGWCVSNDRSDLAIVLLTIAQEGGILSANYKLATRFEKFIKADYPTAFSESAIIHFSVEVE